MDASLWPANDGPVRIGIREYCLERRRLPPDESGARDARPPIT